MTNCISGTVMELSQISRNNKSFPYLSAMLVDSRTLRLPAGGCWNAFACSSLKKSIRILLQHSWRTYLGILECNGSTHNCWANALSAPLIQSSNSWISAIPGRNTRILWCRSCEALVCRYWMRRRQVSYIAGSIPGRLIYHNWSVWYAKLQSHTIGLGALA